MKNKILSERTAADIDAQVVKVLRGIGNPEPPIPLEQVRELLRLDRQFYSTSDHGVLREMVSRITIAGKQVLARPTLLAEAVKAFDLKALYLPDRKRILIDSALPESKVRWSESHEIVHSILEWHQSLMLGDNKLTLTPACHEQIEAEANYGAGKLTFPERNFQEMSRGSRPQLELVQNLGKTFGNSLTSTLWTFVERSSDIMFGVVCPHPRYLPSGFDRSNPCRYFIRSKSFIARFSNVLETHAFEAIASYCGWRKRGPLGEAQVVLADQNGDNHIFMLETFSNTYEALTLGVYCGPQPVLVQVA